MHFSLSENLFPQECQKNDHRPDMAHQNNLSTPLNTIGSPSMISNNCEEGLQIFPSVIFG